ncbi:ubiquinone biosynthesis protein COQ9, mitochondrial [Musca vetustissima]|uniref:ubiquinone biosynthesis protein COQ9, mitochondrial n=1 Tax=Musca vetustissima TaxID=27455 RepID=UPI002AB6FC38|nr:ubiquinone biosynthesis protein COQ9, mitochondrial [Musca vetustissima]
MANFSALNKMIKLQKLLNNKNINLCHVACRNLITSPIMASNCQNFEQQVSQTIETTQSQQHCWNHIEIGDSSKYSIGRCSLALSNNNARHHNINTANRRTFCTKTTQTIDEFRAREEKREAEYEQQEQAKSQEEENERDAKAEAVRVKILEAALQHVPTLGWTRNAIVQGAEDVGYPSVVHGMFPQGGFDLVSYFNGKCNEELLKILKKETDDGKKEINNPLEFLVRFVRLRLEMMAPYKGQWPQALALIALPQNASTALAQVLTLVDDICYYSGDRSVDIGWYTRRIGLASIMKMTELYMLQDHSPDHSKTWEFLANRMDDAVQLQMTLMNIGGTTSGVQRSLKSAFITARSILGLNYNKS